MEKLEIKGRKQGANGNDDVKVLNSNKIEAATLQADKQTREGNGVVKTTSDINQLKVSKETNPPEKNDVDKTNDIEGINGNQVLDKEDKIEPEDVKNPSNMLPNFNQLADEIKTDEKLLVEDNVITDKTVIVDSTAEKTIDKEISPKFEIEKADQQPTKYLKQEPETTKTTNEIGSPVSEQNNDKHPQKDGSPTKQLKETINVGQAPVEVEPQETGINNVKEDPRTSINDKLSLSRSPEDVKIPEMLVTQKNVDTTTYKDAPVQSPENDKHLGKLLSQENVDNIISLNETVTPVQVSEDDKPPEPVVPGADDGKPLETDGRGSEDGKPPETVGRGSEDGKPPETAAPGSEYDKPLETAGQGPEDGKPPETQFIPKDVDPVFVGESGNVTQSENGATQHIVSPTTTLNVGVTDGQEGVDIKGSEIRINEQTGEAKTQLNDTESTRPLPEEVQQPGTDIGQENGNYKTSEIDTPSNVPSPKTEMAKRNVETKGSLKEQDDGLTEVFKTISNVTVHSQTETLGRMQREHVVNKLENVDKDEPKIARFSVDTDKQQNVAGISKERVIQKTLSGPQLIADQTIVDTEIQQNSRQTGDKLPPDITRNAVLLSNKKSDKELVNEIIIGKPILPYVKADEKVPQITNKGSGYLITPSGDSGYKVQRSPYDERFDTKPRGQKQMGKTKAAQRYYPQNEYLTSNTRNAGYKLDQNTFRDNYYYKDEVPNSSFPIVSPDNRGINIQVSGEGLVTIQTAPPTINSPGATTITVAIGPPTSTAQYGGAAPYRTNQVSPYNQGYSSPYAGQTHKGAGIQHHDGTVVPREFIRPSRYQQGAREGQQRVCLQTVQRRDGYGHSASVSSYPGSYRSSRYGGFASRMGGRRPGRPLYGTIATFPPRQTDTSHCNRRVNSYNAKLLQNPYNFFPAQHYYTDSRGIPRTNQKGQTLDGRVYPAQNNLWPR